MNPRSLTVVFCCVLIAVLIESPLLFILASVSAIVSIALQGTIPRKAALVFWLWLNFLILLLLIWNGELSTTEFESSQILNVPLSPFTMIVGIWLAPILIWPLVFIFDFRNWKNK